MTCYKNHVFICTNQKTDNKQCCANANAAELATYAKQRAKELGLNAATGCRISTSGCMGRCADGPVMVVYPRGAWYTSLEKSDIDTLLLSLVAESADCTS